MSSSSSTSRHGGRRSVYGVPTKCWCGQALDIWVSETKENPYRRFYRCKIALQNKSESHLFKWEDEAIIDEIRMVDAKQLDLVHDFQNFAKNTTVHLQSQTQMQDEINVKMMELSKDIHESTMLMKEQIDAQRTANINNHIRPFHQIGAVLAICGAMTYLYLKLH